MYNVICFDLETTARGGPDGTSPDAQWKDNRVLLCGWSSQGGVVEVEPNMVGLSAEIWRLVEDHGEVILVAHNAKFDLKYLMREYPGLPWPHIRVWDTMTWEYLHSGHRTKMASLEETADKYGIKFSKTLDLGALLSAGVKMEDIPEEELTEYLIGDVEALMFIFKCQSIESEYFMDYILPLAEMELNGLELDQAGAEAMAVEMQAEINESHDYIRDYIIEHCEWQDGSPIIMDDFTDLVAPKGKVINPTANRTLSFLLTGMPEELNTKLKKWKVTLKGNPILSSSDIEYLYDDIEPSHLGYPMDEDVIDKMSNLVSGTVNNVLDHVIKHRKNSKIVNTYLLPMLQQARIHGTVHPKLNTAITATGRLSSSEPNGQNMPPVVRSLIKAPPSRKLEELDFSQLEMVGAASISGDKDLIYDLGHGVDVHKNTATKVFGAGQAEAKRKLAKNVNFGVLYGGKAHGLSKQTGVDKGTVQDLIDAFYSSYPGVAKWQRQLFEDVVDNMVAHDIKDGEQRYRSDYVLPISGRRFRFIETQAPAWVRAKTRRSFSFSPNHTANYPIQGFAGGDIVMYGLYKLWAEVRELYRPNDVRFLLTVHDSILMDIPECYTMTAHYDNMIDAIQQRFNLPVPLQYDVEAGPTWS